MSTLHILGLLLAGVALNAAAFAAWLRGKRRANSEPRNELRG